MENETMNQNVPIQNMQSETYTAPVTPPKSSSHSVLYIIIGAVVVIAAAAFWYLSSLQQTEPATVETPIVTNETQPAQAPVSGNTTADISADLNQIDSSSALDTEAAASADSVSGF